MMKSLSLLTLVAALAAAPSFAGTGGGCPFGAAASTSGAEDPARAAVDALAAAMAAKDDAAIAAAFTEDAGYAYSLDGALNRGERFDGWLVSDITGPDSVFVIESATVEGGRVDALVLWGRGAATTPARYVFEVVDGRIDGWRMTSR